MLSSQKICNYNITYILIHYFPFCYGSILFLTNAFLAYAPDPGRFAFLYQIRNKKYRRVLYDTLLWKLLFIRIEINDVFFT
jgi:hypothetical protein